MKEVTVPQSTDADDTNKNLITNTEKISVIKIPT